MSSCAECRLPEDFDQNIWRRPLSMPLAEIVALALSSIGFVFLGGPLLLKNHGLFIDSRWPSVCLEPDG